MSQIKELSAYDLVGRYVKVRSDKPGGQIFGYFTEALSEDDSEGYVYCFATRSHVPVAVSHCLVVEIWDLTGGFKEVPVVVRDFGEGVIYDEFVSGSAFKVRVRNPKGLMTTVPFSAVKVQIPPRG